MIAMENELVKLLLTISGWGIPTLVVIYFISKWSKIKEICIDLWFIISSLIKKGQRLAVSSKIESICEKTIRDLNNIVPELDLPNVSVEWIKPSDDETVIPPQVEEGKAIVLLKYNRDFTQNIVNTTAAYIKNQLLPESREYMSKGIRQAIDFTIIRRFLHYVPNSHNALTYFVRQHKEETRNNQQNMMKITSIEDAGMLSRILLREYQMWGNNICGNPVEEKYEVESKQFLDYLFGVSSREHDDYTQLQFVSENIKVGILLVAKIETYEEAGIEPYVRRIREGFSKGIKTFYLLARNEKIEILRDVFSELLGTGCYSLLNGPKIFKDSQNRDNICYCIEVDSNGDIATDYAQIKDRIEAGDTIEAVISSIFRYEIRCRYNTLDIIIPVDNISSTKDIRLRNYYKLGTTVILQPLSINDDGSIQGSFLNTESDPKRLIDSRYSVGSEVSAIIEKVEQDYVLVRVKDTDITCISYRKYLTYSQLMRLSDLFSVGEERTFTIKEINYVHFSFVLALSNLQDPWLRLPYHQSEDMDFSIMRIDSTCFVTELGDGIRALLPYSELTWFESLIDVERSKYNVGDVLHARIKAINERAKVVILTMREKISPYNDYKKFLIENSNNIIVELKEKNAYGLLGLHDNKYSVFIPYGETRIGDNYFKYTIGKQYEVHIKEIGNRGTSYIGTFKPFIQHPLAVFSDYYQEGDSIENCKILKRSSKYCIVGIPKLKRMSYTGILPISEVVNIGKISSLQDSLSLLENVPLIIKSIDFDRNSICFSLKKYTSNNRCAVDYLLYTDIKHAIVIAKYYNDYIVIIPDLWIEGILETNNSYNEGQKINVRLVGRSEQNIFFTDEP